MGEDYALQARVQIDTDEPSIEGLQSLLLIHHSFLAAGMGRKAYMLLSELKYSLMCSITSTKTV